MLRKRTRSHQKDQHKMGHLDSDVIQEPNFHYEVLGQKQRTSSFFNVPGLFVGFSPKGEIDSVKSPTSPLDFRVFSNLGNPFRSPKSPREGLNNKNWGSDKVGLSIIESLEEETKSGKVLPCLDGKSIVLGPQIRTKTSNVRTRFQSFDKPNSLPKNYAIFPYPHTKQTNTRKGNLNTLFGNQETESFDKILSCSLDSKSCGSHLTNKTPKFSNFAVAKQPQIPESVDCGNGLIESLSASEIELSEDYTCITTHGPNPKTTHIFGDCILECHNNEFITNLPKDEDLRIPFSSEIPTSYPSDDFLSFCYACKKRLEGEDIYMYRGEKAFCSNFCRSEEILIDEAMEKAKNESSRNSNKSDDSREELLETGIFIAI